MVQEIMKLEIVQEYALTKDKPMCGTCKFRGNVSTAWDPAAEDSVLITGVQCNHPLAVDENTKYDSICEQYTAVNDTLARLFATKRLI